MVRPFSNGDVGRLKLIPQLIYPWMVFSFWMGLIRWTRLFWLLVLLETTVFSVCRLQLLRIVILIQIQNRTVIQILLPLILLALPFVFWAPVAPPHRWPNQAASVRFLPLLGGCWCRARVCECVVCVLVCVLVQHNGDRELGGGSSAVDYYSRWFGFVFEFARRLLLLQFVYFSRKLIFWCDQAWFIPLRFLFPHNSASASAAADSSCS